MSTRGNTPIKGMRERDVHPGTRCDQGPDVWDEKRISSLGHVYAFQTCLGRVLTAAMGLRVCRRKMGTGTESLVLVWATMSSPAMWLTYGRPAVGSSILPWSIPRPMTRTPERAN